MGCTHGPGVSEGDSSQGPGRTLTDWRAVGRGSGGRSRCFVRRAAAGNQAPQFFSVLCARVSVSHLLVPLQIEILSQSRAMLAQPSLSSCPLERDGETRPAVAMVPFSAPSRLPGSFELWVSRQLTAIHSGRVCLPAVASGCLDMYAGRYSVLWDGHLSR